METRMVTIEIPVPSDYDITELLEKAQEFAAEIYEEHTGETAGNDLYSDCGVKESE